MGRMRRHPTTMSLAVPMIGCDLQSHPRENRFLFRCVRDCKSRTIRDDDQHLTPITHFASASTSGYTVVWRGMRGIAWFPTLTQKRLLRGIEMKVIVIGGSGHVGGFLTPMLADDGNQVVVVSSGRTKPHTAAPASVRNAAMSYGQMLADGSFRKLVQEEKPDAVVDILQGNVHGVYNVCKELNVRQLVVCGSVWMFGRPKVVPCPEIAQTVCPFEGYETRFREMREVQAESMGSGISFSAIMPPNICGPGKIPLDGAGGRSIDVHKAHKAGKPVILPDPGTNLVGPCDAQDIARAFFLALNNPTAAAGEIFNVGSAYALTSERLIGVFGEIYGSKIPIEYVSPEKYRTEVSPDLGDNFHFLEHMCPDITKIRTKLGYNPANTPEQTLERAIRWMFDKGLFA